MRLHSIQAYWSSVFVFPKKILKGVNEVLRRFIWSGTKLKKYDAKVDWDDVCCPKKEWGLGIKCIVVWDKACMLRHYGIWLARKIICGLNGIILIC